MELSDSVPLVVRMFFQHGATGWSHVCSVIDVFLFTLPHLVEFHFAVAPLLLLKKSSNANKGVAKISKPPPKCTVGGVRETEPEPKKDVWNRRSSRLKHDWNTKCVVDARALFDLVNLEMTPTADVYLPAV